MAATIRRWSADDRAPSGVPRTSVPVAAVRAGECVGYGATWTARSETAIGIIAAGYGDGYSRFLPSGTPVLVNGRRAELAGRVSMDLTAIDVSTAPGLAEGDWLSLNYHLPTASAASGMSQYELLTGLGSRFGREWR